MSVNTNEKYDHLFKVLLIGDSGVGKSSILLRFTGSNFPEEIGSTIGVDFKIKYMNLQNKKLKLTIWDTAGQERFRTLTSSYYRGAQACILVYDISNPKSFENMKNWAQELSTYATYDNVVKLLDETRQVTRKMGEMFAKENGMLFLECSAKTNEKIQQAFEEICYQIFQNDNLLDNTSPVGLDEDVKQPGSQDSNGDNETLCFCL
eukprot:gene5828-9651_t